MNLIGGVPQRPVDLCKVKARDVLILRGISLRGRNRIREHGERWLVREVDSSVLGRNLGFLVCPATYLGGEHLDPQYDRPDAVHQRDGYCRWVRKTRDEHFEIIRAEVLEP